MSSIINLMLSFFNYEKIKQNEEIVEINNSDNSSDKIKQIYNIINNEITMEEYVMQTYDIYQKSLINLSILNKKIHAIEIEIEDLYNSNKLNKYYYNKKLELDKLYEIYKNDEISSYDKKRDYIYAYNKYYK